MKNKKINLMYMNFFLDVSALSISKAFTYKGGFNLGTQYFKHANEEERTRRARLYLEATKSMNDYANQARNAVSKEPQQVLIVFDTVLSRKASRFFTANEQEQKNILAELDARGVMYFIDNDKWVSASFSIRHPSSLDDNIFSFAEISYRLFDQFVQIFFVGFSVHGNIRVAARP